MRKVTKLLMMRMQDLIGAVLPEFFNVRDCVMQKKAPGFMPGPYQIQLLKNYLYTDVLVVPQLNLH